MACAGSGSSEDQPLPVPGEGQGELVKDKGSSFFNCQKLGGGFWKLSETLL